MFLQHLLGLAMHCSQFIDRLPAVLDRDARLCQPLECLGIVPLHLSKSGERQLHRLQLSGFDHRLARQTHNAVQIAGVDRYRSLFGCGFCLRVGDGCRRRDGRAWHDRRAWRRAGWLVDFGRRVPRSGDRRWRRGFRRVGGIVRLVAGRLENFPWFWRWWRFGWRFGWRFRRSLTKRLRQLLVPHRLSGEPVVKLAFRELRQFLKNIDARQQLVHAGT